jgi:hypothetical protein
MISDEALRPPYVRRYVTGAAQCCPGGSVGAVA